MQLLYICCVICLWGPPTCPGLGKRPCYLTKKMVSSSSPERQLTSAIASRERVGLGVVNGRPKSCAPNHL